MGRQERGKKKKERIEKWNRQKTYNNKADLTLNL